MPRKQRFKPSRKPKQVEVTSQQPSVHSTSPAANHSPGTTTVTSESSRLDAVGAVGPPLASEAAGTAHARRDSAVIDDGNEAPG